MKGLHHFTTGSTITPATKARIESLKTTDLMRFNATIGGAVYYRALKLGFTYGSATTVIGTISYCIAESLL